MRTLSKMHSRVVSAKRQRGFFIFGGGGVARAPQIQRSIRLRRSATAYLSRAFANGSATQWTHHQIFKRGTLDAYDPIFGTSLAGGEGAYLHSDNTLVIAINGAVMLKSNRVFRDPGAHMDIVLASDMGNATASLKFRVYINNEEITSWSTDTRSSYSSWTYWNRSAAANHYIGYSNALGAYSDSYRARVIHVDGQVLTPASFCQYDSNGFWQPKEYTGTYGTTGFRLRFDDPTNTTTLCADSSGNSNNWTANNISLTAGATYDSMLDVPLGGGGSERGNYCTLNPLALNVGLSGGAPTEANLKATHAANTSGVLATALPTSGKWYWEVLVVQGGDSCGIGILRNADTGLLSSGAGYGQTGGSYTYREAGTKRNNSSSAAYGAAYTTADLIGVEYDADAQTLAFRKNNTSQGLAYSGLTEAPYFPVAGASISSTNNVLAFNFGQRPFTYTPPSGFKALHTGNLPDPAIPNPKLHFDAGTYTGNGSTLLRSGFGFRPGLVWLKSRSNGGLGYRLVDAVRGVGFGLGSHTTSSEFSEATGVTSFNSDGYSLGSDATYNTNTSSYVDWLWKAGSTTVTNNDGNISSQVSANPLSGFSVVRYSTTGAASATVGHGLGAAPKMVIVKIQNGGNNWVIWHQAFTNDEWIYFTTTGKGSAAGGWNSALPTSTVLSVANPASGNSWTTSLGYNYIAYCFAEVTGFSKLGSYTGNGSADGPFVHCGFRPRFVMRKRVDTGGYDWVIWDTAREPANQAILTMFPNASSVESSSNSFIDILSNGFKVRDSGAASNASGGTYIYAAFAEAPFKYALAR